MASGQRLVWDWAATLVCSRLGGPGSLWSVGGPFRTPKMLWQSAILAATATVALETIVGCRWRGRVAADPWGIGTS